MWKDLPIGGPSTFAFRGLSSVPQGTEWVFGSGNKYSTRITVPWHSYTRWQAYLPTSGHLTIHNGQTWVQDPISWQWFNLYFPHMPCYGTSPKTESQVSMTMEVSELLLWAALDTSSQALWCSNPKRPMSLPSGAPPHHARKLHQTSGHLLSGVATGKHSRQCWTRWSDPWRGFPTSWNFGAGH